MQKPTRWTGKKPPDRAGNGDHWYKYDDGTLWEADIIKREWFPIKSVTYESLEGSRIPFSPKTKVYHNVV